MTTLRDYVLDCRCPNCGTLMQQQKPKRRSLLSRLTPFIVALLAIACVFDQLHRHWAQAAVDVGIATFLVVIDR